MSKVPVSWSFQELVTSAKLTQMVTDYETPGLCVLNSAGIIRDTYAPIVSAFNVNNAGLGIYPYNANKSIYDTMHILWSTGANGDIVAVAPGIKYSLDSWGTQVNAVSDNPYPVVGPLLLCHGFFGGVSNSQSGWDVVDISGVTGFNWFVWAFNGGTATGNGGPGASGAEICWRVTVFLANSTDTPF